MGIAQGETPTKPFYHNADIKCDSDCGYMDCRWLNCGCEGHTDPTFVNPIQFWTCKFCNLVICNLIEDLHMNGKCN